MPHREAEFAVIAEIARRMKQDKVREFGNDPDESLSDLMSFTAGIRGGKQLFVVYHGPGPYSARQCCYWTALFTSCTEIFLVADARYRTFEPLEGWHEGMSNEEYEKLFYEQTGYGPGKISADWEAGMREEIKECLVISRFPYIGPTTSAHYMYEQQGTKLTWRQISQFDNDVEGGAIQDYVKEAWRKRKEIQPQIDEAVKKVHADMTREDFPPAERQYWTDRGMASFLSAKPGVFLVQYLGGLSDELPDVVFKDGKEMDTSGS
jgi:hypothetical protein